MTEPLIVRELDELLEASKADPEFKDAVRALSRGENQERINFNWGAPPVKVLRLISKILEMCPQEPIESVEIHGTSGCSNFSGKALLQPGERHIEFDWDCRWRAEQEGWRDFFGEPDQIRAAHQFGYQCFRVFKLDKPALKPTR